MDVSFRTIRMLEVVRYPRPARRDLPELDGYRNWFHLMTDPFLDGPLVQTESGINPVRAVTGPDGARRPAIILRTSAWKAGQETTPWEDVYDLDHGHVRYFGDHKIDKLGPVGSTPGNAALLAAWEQHVSPSRADRELAPPIFVVKAKPVQVDGRTVNKGYLEFCGVGVIERLEFVVQRDPLSDRTFPNLVVDLAIFDPGPDDEVDLRWIDDRRDATLSTSESHRYAPASWRAWTAKGKVAVPQARRRVLSSRVKSRSQQQPALGTSDDQMLTKIYRYFDDSKHAFESLAAAVSSQVFQRSSGRYLRGWISRAGGDGGLDFVGRLDAGSSTANTPLVVLGQAKCIRPASGISPDQVARVVARLKRGWLGIYVTTGYFTQQAQLEVIDDEYPIVLVSGLELVREVRMLAEESYGGDVDALLAEVTAEYDQQVAHRRADEVLAL